MNHPRRDRDAADLVASLTAASEASTIPNSERATRAERAERLARHAVDWLLDCVDTGSGDPSLYHGQAGVVLALREAADHFDDARCLEAVEVGADELAARVDRLEDCSLYFGLAGLAGTLHAIGRPVAARHAVSRVRRLREGDRWNAMFELLVGNAGIGLGALWAGDLDLAVDAVDPYRTSADPTAAGVNWQVRPTPPRSHHLAHGTLGIAYALAAVGQAAAREDLIELAIAGATDVVSRNEAGPDGFRVAHSDPPHRPDLIERYSLGWCNGPAGDAQVFRLLARVTGDPTWIELGDRCWHTISRSGLPARLRPGFWDNSGRCCGTAGVLALACDRSTEYGDDLGFAAVLVDDLLARATVDRRGARWSNREHRAAVADLAPVPGWAMGNAGIIRELLRYVRLVRGERDGYAVQWPDHPTVTPGLRT